MWCLPTPRAEKPPGPRGAQRPPQPLLVPEPWGPSVCSPTSQLGKVLGVIPEPCSPFEFLSEVWLLRGGWDFSCCPGSGLPVPSLVFSGCPSTPRAVGVPMGLGREVTVPLAATPLGYPGDILGLRVPDLPRAPTAPLDAWGGFLPDFRHLSLSTDDPATPTGQTRPGVPSLQAGGVTEGSTPPSPW